MKVLIISHTALCTHNNMGKTLASLFSGFRKEELCQLYIYPMLPDLDKCCSYYRITDKDVLKRLFSFHVRGREIHICDIDTHKHTLYENPQDRKLYRNPRNKRASRLLLRDLLWKLSPWYGEELAKWVAFQKPTCIFVAPGISKFLYDIALKISKEFDLPVVTYICDDFYFMKPGKGFWEKISKKLLERKIEELLGKTTHLIGICDEVTEKYRESFRIPATTIMTGASFAAAEKPFPVSSPRSMTYMGNIRYNRNVCLAEMGMALDALNREYQTDYQLRVYTIEQDPKLLSVFDGIKSVTLCGFVTGEAFDRVFRESEILVHTEAFDESSMELTKYSVSTKIADALASGIPLFAYGPSEIASMAHLIRNDCAIVVTKKDALKVTLRNMFEDRTFCCAKVEKGLETARRCHSEKDQSEKMKHILREIE